MTSGFRILALIGPTASGKSALGVAIARKIGGEILGVDSMQVYRGMDVGTAKPSPDERLGVPHHLVDVVDPTETFTAARFVEMADGVLARAQSRGVPIVAAGGTPLYFKSLFEGLFEGPGADESIRAALRDEPLESLHERLTRIDPEASRRIHLNDRRRMIRAIEVFELTGKPISAQQREWDSQIRHQASWIGLNAPREVINGRINARVKAMMQAGWLEEARDLLARHRELSKTAAGATGYAELFSHLRGRITLEDAIERIKIATRQLARRQMKWFRRFEQVNWLDARLDLDALMRQLEPNPLAFHHETDARRKR
jgi:tRNA dimethylallyltransferase